MYTGIIRLLVVVSILKAFTHIHESSLNFAGSIERLIRMLDGEACI